MFVRNATTFGYGLYYTAAGAFPAGELISFTSVTTVLTSSHHPGVNDLLRMGVLNIFLPCICSFIHIWLNYWFILPKDKQAFTITGIHLQSIHPYA